MAATVDVRNDAIADRRRTGKGPAWAGIAFLPLFVIGFIMAASTPANDATDAQWISWYQDRGHQVTTIAGSYLLIAAGLLFLVMVYGLQERVKVGRADAPVLYRFVGGTGLLVSAFILVAAVNLGGIMGNILFGSQPPPLNADVLRANIGVGSFALTACLVCAVYIACIAMMARKAGVFGSGMVAFSYVMAVLLLLGVMFIPILALPIWVFVTGIALLRRA